ncbi:hypothetical protein CHS0354_005105 [Potamilus streckersoni]|uniref:Dynamin-binding protein n=1 Tax=Potamilus streckersoni TaxID=2493646 RepID=A0AAE0SHQ0_9BIVA|nr:hypothetical protein CHS0354_005105 [Potamilus streckersoni]
MRPEAEEYVGHFVKAIYDFHTNQPGELKLMKDDILKVTKVIDKNWLHGQLETVEGNFPTSFVEKIVLPSVDVGQTLFAATDNFPAQQDGDLEFRKGDIIIGLQKLDGNWWQGKKGTQEGMFPTTHVVELEVPKSLQARSKNVHSNEPLFGQALCDSVAQLDGELGFKAGEIITVTEVVDEDWYIGELGGKKGMFLASCVVLLNATVVEDAQVNSDQQIKHEEIPISNGVRSRNSNETNSNAVDAEIPQLNSAYLTNQNLYNTEIQQSSSLHVQNSYTSENTRSHDSSVTPYARTLYPFHGQLPDEISFKDNEIVTLIQHVDEQWIEGEKDGRIGVFPASYVEIVVDCPYAYQIEEPENLQTCSHKHSEPILQKDSSQDMTSVTTNQNNTVEQYGLVLYNFPAETKGDLDLREGDTVTVLKYIDENWLQARDEKGIVGMCPINFIDILGSSPEQSTTLATKKEKIYSEPIKVSEQKSASVIKPHSQSTITCSSTVTTEHKTVKPVVKPKPQLAPKPVIKPKPSLGVKPKDLSANTSSSKSFVGEKEIPGRSSHLSSAITSNEFLTKSHSMDEMVSFGQEKKDDQSSLVTTNSESKVGSTWSLSAVDRVSSRDTPTVNSLGNRSLSPSLDEMIKNELRKSRAGSLSSLNTSRPGIPSSDVNVKPLTGNTSYMQKDLETSRPSLANKSWQGSKTNYAGNSTFYFEDDFVPSDTKTEVKPQTNSPPRLSGIVNENIYRKPSLRKAPPVRPTGPRIASAPSKVPLIPIKVYSENRPSRPAPPRPVEASSHSLATGGVRKARRPAPPRPGRSPPRKIQPAQPRSEAGPDLMSFSPPQSCVDQTETPDPEAVQELKRRVEEMEQDLENCKKSKQEMEKRIMNMNEGEEEQAEIHDNLQFYEDNIQGITQELKTLKENLHKMCPAEQDKIAREKAAEAFRQEEEKRQEEDRKRQLEERQKRKDKREKVIEEILQTEKDFLASLQLTIYTFIGPMAEKLTDIDTESLFGNIEEVADVSQKLLTKLEDAVNGKDFAQQMIGPCFIVMAEDMKLVYAPYCRNHDEVIELIEKYMENDQNKAFFDKQLDKMREKSVVFDLEALLIKPVQRILKYPLLLNELIKVTEESHPDKIELLSAINAMTDVATAINEYKRRKDLVFKYKKESDASLGDKLAKLSLHSIKKKSNRFRERFSANLGIVDQTRDENFEKVESKIRALEKTVKIFIKDVQAYIDQVQENLSCQESFVADLDDFYMEKRVCQEVQQYQKVFNYLKDQIFTDFKSQVSDLVVSPLTQLSQSFVGPIKVIQKRYDKLLDYDNMSRRYKDEKATDKAVQAAKNDYEALNAQLLDELPKLYKLAFQLFQDCIAAFVRAQHEFQDKNLKQMYSVMDIKVLSEEGVIETFNIKHATVVDRLSILSFMPKNFSPRVADLKQDTKKSKRLSLDPQMTKVPSMEVAPQNEGQRCYVLEKHIPTKVFRVTQTFTAVDLMDISLFEGDLVGVLKEQDPMGNKERWFVDNGATKGFAPKKILSSYQPSPTQSRMPSGSAQVTLQPLSGTVHYSSQSSPRRGSNQYVAGQNVTHSGGGGAGNMLQEVKEIDMDFALDEDMCPALPEEQTDSQDELTLTAPAHEDDELPGVSMIPITSICCVIIKCVLTEICL